tara:strand:- start:21 stop:689 length:669 start_codon:yes stop_codon:yes gene_type:complete
MSQTIITAVDETNFDSFKRIVDCLDPKLCMIKVGSVAFNSIGQDAIFYAASKGFDIFLDLKLHDIPNTVKKSIEGLKFLPIKMLTIHISGGLEMMKAAVLAAKDKKIEIFGVTALTSLSNKDTNIIFKRNTKDQVDVMLDLAQEADIDGVVCSPHELEIVTKRKSLKSITPGIRLSKNIDDQIRVMTPKEAINKGSNYLVIGRPITAANDINRALNEIYNLI